MRPNSRLAKVWSKTTHLVVEKASGAHLYTTDGQKYLDFSCGIGVTNTGHAHPRVAKAIADQAGKIIHSQINCYTTPVQHDLADKLHSITPDHIDTFFFSNSGAEATEGAVKLAKQFTGRPNVIVFHGSFHGRTHQAMAMTTSKSVYRLGSSPLPSNVIIAPFPSAFREGLSPEESSRRALAQLDHILHDYAPPQEVAAMFLETVLGEGGYLPVPAPFLEGLRAICDKHGILLVIDEVQCGFGRTGKMFAYEHYNVKPDLILMAKGIASGLPLSCVAGPSHIMDKWVPGSHGGTYGGNAVACAAALATIEAIQDEKMCENAAARGQELMTGLKDIQSRFPSLIGDVRGLGTMIGTEFVGDKAVQAVQRTVKHCLEDGKVILLTAGGGQVVRWIPPLPVTKDQVNQALETFDAALTKTSKEL